MGWDGVTQASLKKSIFFRRGCQSLRLAPMIHKLRAYLEMWPDRTLVRDVALRFPGDRVNLHYTCRRLTEDSKPVRGKTWNETIPGDQQWRTT